MAVEKGRLFLEPTRACRVITVEQGDVFAARQFEPAVARTRNPEVAPVTDDANARVVIRAEHFDTAVSRTVVDQQELKIPKALCQYAVNGRADVGFPVIDRNKDGDFGWIV